jgi:hypothetical protein
MTHKVNFDGLFASSPANMHSIGLSGASGS